MSFNGKSLKKYKQINLGINANRIIGYLNAVCGALEVAKKGMVPTKEYVEIRDSKEEEIKNILEESGIEGIEKLTVVDRTSICLESLSGNYILTVDENRRCGTVKKHR